MSDYIKSMRQKVGHTPILQCGASVIVENEKGEILLQLGADNKCWGYAGGSVELDVHICKDYSGGLKADPTEVLDLKFFPLHALPDNISPPNIKPLTTYKHLNLNS